MSDTFSIDDLELPKAVVGRVLKNALPEGTNVNKDARLAANRAATVFVSYLASVSNDITKSSNHKTITSSHVMKALEIVELDHLIEPLQASLEAYQQLLAEKKHKKKDDDEKEDGKSKEEEEELEDVQMLETKVVDDKLEDEDEDMETPNNDDPVVQNE